jgi:hypothetical protein
MPTKKKVKISSAIRAKARQALRFSEERVKKVSDWAEFSNALFAVGGKATVLFRTEAERTAFCRTEEYKRILALMDTLPAPPVKGFVEMVASANGAISVRLPRSVHADLLAEAKAEGVSLNQLCVSKLVAQLRAVI